MTNMINRPKIKKRIQPRSDYKKNNTITLFLILIPLVTLIFLLTLDFYTPQINLTLNHKKIGNSITINYKEKYIEPTAEAFYQNRNITDQITTSGKVDSNKIGEYKIYYKVKEGLFYKTKVLKVSVKDLSAPTIKLVGLQNTAVCPGQKYQEEGYKAYDNLEGDITEKVKVKKVRDKIIYSVKDKAGNEKEIVRTITYEDKTPPVLELKGSAYETAYLNEKFIDPGVVVSDNCDNNLEDKIEVEGNVDTSKPASYERIYKVEDQSGNKATIKRTINVVEHGQNGTIYLTFDDGPKKGTTDVILDILKEENVKATFFITNGGPDDLVVREFKEGHTVALHTASHNYSYLYSSVDNYYQDLYSVKERVKRLTGSDAKIIRFPGGSSNTISRRYSDKIMSFLTKDVVEKGFRYYDWNLASGDAGEIHTAEGIYEHVTKKLSKDRVNMVLMHDIKPYTRDALKKIIEYGKENGYNFDKITEKTDMIKQRVNN